MFRSIPKFLGGILLLLFLLSPAHGQAEAPFFKPSTATPSTTYRPNPAALKITTYQQALESLKGLSAGQLAKLQKIARRRVSAGGYHSLYLNENGEVFSWGLNNYGQLGHGDKRMRWYPTKIAGISNAIDVAASEDHSVVLLADGSIAVFGANGTGQFCNGTLGSSEGSDSPVVVADLSGVQAIGVRPYGTMLSKKDGSVWWCGQPWSQKSPQEIRFTDKSMPVEQLAGNGTNAVAIQNGKAMTWGTDLRVFYSIASIFVGDDFNNEQAHEVKGLDDVLDIAVAGAALVAVKKDGMVYQWGIPAGSDWGEYGSPKTPRHLNLEIPTRVLGIEGGVKQVAGGGPMISLNGPNSQHVLALTYGGKLYAWGDNEHAELGNGGTTSSSVPVRVPLDKVTHIAAGKYHNLAMRGDGSIWHWGVISGFKAGKPESGEALVVVPTPKKIYPFDLHEVHPDTGIRARPSGHQLKPFILQ